MYICKESQEYYINYNILKVGVPKKHENILHLNSEKLLFPLELPLYQSKRDAILNQNHYV